MATAADHNEDVYRIAQHIGPKCAELIRRAIDAGIVFAHNVEDVDEAVFLVKLCRAWLAVNSDRSLSGDTATVVNTTDVTTTSGPGVTATTVGTSTPHRDPDELVRSLVEPSPRSLDISVSLTDACGNGCLHCSTCALPGGASVPFSRIGPALSGAAQFAKILHIACEGDPMFYFSEGHDIADVVSLLWGLGFSTVSVQFLPPMPAKHQVLQRLLAALETEVSNRRSAATTLPTPSSSSPTATTEENPLDEQCYHAFPPLNPVVSFNLYSPRCDSTAWNGSKLTCILQIFTKCQNWLNFFLM
ncbi:hypothetical protein Pelo_19201 [Pelomyxa schiedti]|nr:hypothetical protein Pelo_19201 [Pelomyxa schiedti]